MIRFLCNYSNHSAACSRLPYSDDSDSQLIVRETTTQDALTRPEVPRRGANCLDPSRRLRITVAASATFVGSHDKRLPDSIECRGCFFEFGDPVGNLPAPLTANRYKMAGLNGAPEEIRTPDPQIRSLEWPLKLLEFVTVRTAFLTENHRRGLLYGAFCRYRIKRVVRGLALFGCKNMCSKVLPVPPPRHSGSS